RLILYSPLISSLTFVTLLFFRRSNPYVFVLSVSSDCSFFFFFFLLLPPPPKSTLFPYTTLFRSRHRPPADHRDRRGPCAHRGRADRKSTRLNSSHVSISYAVFCLKKKKNGKIMTCFRNSL